MDISRFGTVLTKQQRIATLARQSPSMSFTSLNQYLDIDWLGEAYRRTRKDGAPGIDGRTAEEYAENLEGNLESLLNRAKSGTYFAPPVKRTYIPKGVGSKDLRPIGIPTFEDKILQRAVVMLLEPIYEQDFSNCSFGFRPGRSQHQALRHLWQESMNLDGGWVLSLDISKFFDTIDKAHLRTLMEQRVRDGVIKRLIGKWLNAGVFEKGGVHYPEFGSPQGGVVSPLLSNVYLHYVLDLWFETEVKPKLAGKASLVRFADDALILFARKEDADRVLAVLPKRFAKFGLTIHPEKTQLVEFNRPKAKPAELKREERPGTFDFLGFTHYWGSTRKGGWAVKRKTAADRYSRGFKKIAEWCRTHRHDSLKDQHKALCAKLRGHFNYYGISGNYLCLKKFKRIVVCVWRKWLERRSQRGQLPWEKFNLYLERYPLPAPRIISKIPK